MDPRGIRAHIGGQKVDRELSDKANRCSFNVGEALWTWDGMSAAERAETLQGRLQELLGLPKSASVFALLAHAGTPCETSQPHRTPGTASFHPSSSYSQLVSARRKLFGPAGERDDVVVGIDPGAEHGVFVAVVEKETPLASVLSPSQLRQLRLNAMALLQHRMDAEAQLALGVRTERVRGARALGSRRLARVDCDRVDCRSGRVRLLELKSKSGAVSYVPKDVVSGTTVRDLVNAIESDAPGLNVGKVFLVLNNARSTAGTFKYVVAQFKAGEPENDQVHSRRAG